MNIARKMIFQDIPRGKYSSSSPEFSLGVSSKILLTQPSGCAWHSHEANFALLHCFYGEPQLMVMGMSIIWAVSENSMLNFFSSAHNIFKKTTARETRRLYGVLFRQVMTLVTWYESRPTSLCVPREPSKFRVNGGFELNANVILFQLLQRFFVLAIFLAWDGQKAQKKTTWVRQSHNKMKGLKTFTRFHVYSLSSKSTNSNKNTQKPDSTWKTHRKHIENPGIIG